MLREAEIWRDVEGYEGLYQVSNWGNVKSLDRTIINLNKTYIAKERLLTNTPNAYGYLTVGLTKNGKTRTHRINRLVAIAFIANPENKSDVNHIDGDKTNNYVLNLEWSTSSENAQHAFRLGLRKPAVYDRRGENNNRSILSELEVKEIREKYIPFKYSTKKLAIEYNVSESCIYHIINKTSWKENVK